MKKLYYLIVPLFLISLSACLDSPPAEGPIEATGEFEALLKNVETGAPLEDFPVTIFLKVSGFNQPTTFGRFETDESGWITSEIFSFNEDMISLIIIEYEVNGEIRSAEQETELRLRYNPPVNSVSLEFELDLS